MPHFSRFLFHGDITASGKIRPNAITPPAKNGDISVLLDRDMRRDEIIRIGECVAKLRDKTLAGWGGITGAFLQSLGLILTEAEAQCFPAGRHWDIHLAIEDKEQWKHLTGLIAEEASKQLEQVQ